MADIGLAADTLTVHLRGWDAVWALRRRIDVPLSRVRGARHDPAAARAPRGLRAPGTYLPRVITAGTFWRRRGRDFWSVRDPAKAVVVDLTDGSPYARLIVQVDDPAGTVERIEAARQRAR